MALQFVVTPEGRAAIVNAENTGTDPVTVTEIGVTATGFTADPEAVGATLPGELKRLATFAGATVDADTIHVTLRDDGSDVYSLRGFALYLDDGTLFGLYGQAAVILEKSAQAMLLLSTDVKFTQVDATSLTFGDASFINPPATVSAPGVVELALHAEAIAGIDTQRAVTPGGLRAFTDARFGASSPSTFVKGLLSIATAAAVRVALELGNASTKNVGSGNGLDADLLDGQHGAYYRAWSSLTGVPAFASRWPAWAEVTGRPSTFAPSAHGHAWSDLAGVPAFAARWPTWLEVTGKPTAFAPTAHNHAAGDINSGIFDPDRIPALPQSRVSDLVADLANCVKKDTTATIAGQVNSTSAFPLYAFDPSGEGRTGYVGGWGASSFLVVYEFAGGTNSKTFSITYAGSITWDGNTIWHAGNFNPASKSDAGHTHAAGDIVSGVLADGRIPAIGQSKVTGLAASLAAKAPLDSPMFTGQPNAPTQPVSSNATRIATTAFVKAAIAAALAEYSTTSAMNSAIADALEDYSSTNAMNTAIATAVGSRLPKSNPTFTGTMTGPAYNET